MAQSLLRRITSVSVQFKFVGIAVGSITLLGIATATVLAWQLHGWLATRLGMPDPAVHQLLHGVVYSVAAITLAAILVTTIISRWLSRFLYMPVVHLAEVATAVGEGDYERIALAPFRDELGALAQAFNTMTERISASRTELQLSNERLRQRTGEMQALNAITTAALSAEDPHEFLDQAFPQITEILHAEAAELLMYDEEAEAFTVGSQSGMSVGEAPLFLRAAQSCREHGRVMVEVGDRLRRLVDEARPAGQFLGAGACLAAVPLTAGERLLGVLVVFSSQPVQRLTSAMFMDSLALQMHIGLERVILWQQSQRLLELRRELLDTTIRAQEEERRRVARELHDATGQVLTSLLLNLRALERVNTLAEAHEHALVVHELAANVLDSVRSLCSELMPRALDEFGLSEAVRLYIKEFQQRNRIEVDLEVAGDWSATTPPEVQLALYRIVQEALTNVARHSQASHASVTLACRSNMRVAVIEDNGAGFEVRRIEADKQDRLHLGLFGMRERASLAGGKLTVESTPGGGTTIYAAIPLSDE